MAFMNSSSATNGDSSNVPAIKSDSKHFTSLQIFTSYAEPALDEYITQKEQTDLENKHREEEDKLYRFDIVTCFKITNSFLILFKFDNKGYL